MKILLVYSSCGAGHFKAAEALCDNLKRRLPSADIKLVDILDKATPIFRLCYREGYTFVVRRCRWGWGFFFWLTSLRCVRPLMRYIAFCIDYNNTRPFIRFLIDEQFDLIVATHFVPSIMALYARNKGVITSRIVTVITDYGAHPFWINKGVDLYTVASEYVKKQLLAEGIPQAKIIETGIPIGEKFNRTFARKELASRYGIRSDLFTVMLMTGSFGLGPLAEITELLRDGIQILVVCSANEQLRKRLDKKKLKGVYTFGFLENPQELMALSDLIITKPGGLTITEAMAIGTVPIFIVPIPGQEAFNIRVLLEQGIGFYPETLDELKKNVLDLKAHPHRLQVIREKIYAFRKPHATEKICEHLCQGGSGTSP